MDRVILLGRNQAHELLESLLWHKENSASGLYELRIAVDDGKEDTVKFKVNQSMWTPPIGKLDSACRKAARERVALPWDSDKTLENRRAAVKQLWPQYDVEDIAERLGLTKATVLRDFAEVNHE